MRGLWHDEDATVRLGYPPGCGPPAPGIVQEHEVGTVVSHKDAATLNSREQMDIVGGVFEASFTCGDHVMPMGTKQLRDLTGDIVVELETSHALG